MAPAFASSKPLIVVAPEIVTMSSIVVVPPAESIVKFPVEVSISLSPAIPILILSIVAPAFASNRPLTVAIPLTFNVVPTSSFPPI